MSALAKEGLDYFPFDVDLLADRKLRRVKMSYGYLAPMIYIALLSILYKDKGYYIDYSADKKDDVIWDILNFLQGKHQPSAETVEGIIEDLVACELFSGDQFKSKTITSIRAQRTYYRSTVDRKTVNIDFDKWLLSESEMRAISEKSIILSNFIERPINEVNRANNEIKRPINPQSKVKESKVNKSKEERVKTAALQRQTPNFDENSFEFKASEYLRDDILARIPHANIPKTDKELQKWAVHIDRMKRIDGLTETDIRKLIKFAIEDSFWQTNILSTSKLRQKKDTLFAQMTQKERGVFQNGNNHKGNNVYAGKTGDRHDTEPVYGDVY